MTRPSTGSDRSLKTYEEILSGLRTGGWRVVRENATGATIRPRRRLRTLAWVSLWLGLLGLFAGGLGLPLVLYAALDYAASGLAPTLVVSRDTPVLPRPPPERTPVLLIVVVVLWMGLTVLASLYVLLDYFGGDIGRLLYGSGTKP